MLAVLAVILAVLAALDVTVGALSPFDLLALAIAALALHAVTPLAFPRRG